MEIAGSSPRCSGGSGCSGSSLTVLSHDGPRGAMFLEYGHRGAPCCPHAETTWQPTAVATDAITISAVNEAGESHGGICEGRPRINWRTTR